MGGVTYDTGALLAAAAGDRRLWRLHRRALERGHVPTVPAGALAQAPPTGAAPLLEALVNGCRLEPMDEPIARACAALLARSGVGDVLTASVVVGALRRGDLVITGNPAALRRLARSVGRELKMLAVTPAD